MTTRSHRSSAESEGERRLADALRPFGWVCGPGFWERYYSDPWVFNLANAVEKLTAELDKTTKTTADDR